MNLAKLDTRRYFLAAGAFLAVLFAVLDPSSGADLALPGRLLQWTLQVAIPLSLLIPVHLGLSRFSRFDRLNPWIKLSISGLVGSALFSPFALALDFLFGAEDWSQLSGTPTLIGAWLDELAGVLVPVTIVWLGINAPRVLGLDFSQRPAPPAEPTAGEVVEPGPQRFLSLLPAEIGRDIVYIMSELHYLRVVTAKGQALILYNLRDAMAELPAGAGIQTHRSYWVAARHVQRLLVRDGKATLQLFGDTHVPVSRRQLAQVRKRFGG